jgi:hypothetical protein
MRLTEVFKQVLKEARHHRCLREAKSQKQIDEFLNGELTCTGTCRDRYFKIQELLKAQGSALERREVFIKEFLGMGCCGIAYSLPENRVLKITHDPNEACLAYALQGKKLKSVYEVYDVFRMDEHHFGIVQNKLSRLHEEKDKVFLEIVGNRQVVKVLNQFVKDEVTLEQAKAYLKQAVTSAGAWYQLTERQRALKAAMHLLGGINSVKEFAVPDVSPTNTMKKGSVYYLIDMKLRDDVFNLDEIKEEIEVLS